jgi:hypothetical protein
MCVSWLVIVSLQPHDLSNDRSYQTCENQLTDYEISATDKLFDVTRNQAKLVAALTLAPTPTVGRRCSVQPLVSCPWGL